MTDVDMNELIAEGRELCRTDGSGLDMFDYQEQALSTAIYPNRGSNVIYPTLGLAGEAGEMCNKIKKIFRDHGGVLTHRREQELAAELGDVLWYVAVLASELGFTLQAVARLNLTKLESRAARGTLQGSGDQR